MFQLVKGLDCGQFQSSTQSHTVVIDELCILAWSYLSKGHGYRSLVQMQLCKPKKLPSPFQREETFSWQPL